MEFAELTERALAVRARYERLERERYGRPWSLEELTLELVGDLGDLAKLVQAHEGVRQIDDPDEALRHELADVLWAVIVMADRCGIELEAALAETMDSLDAAL